VGKHTGPTISRSPISVSKGFILQRCNEHQTEVPLMQFIMFSILVPTLS